MRLVKFLNGGVILVGIFTGVACYFNPKPVSDVVFYIWLFIAVLSNLQLLIRGRGT